MPGYKVASTAWIARPQPGAVEYAEPKWIYDHDATSNDPHYTNGSLWGICGAASSPATV